MKQHILKLDLKTFYIMKESIIDVITREAKVNDTDLIIINDIFKEGSDYIIIVSEIHDSQPIKFTLTEIMKHAKDGNTCYIDYPSYYKFFKCNEEFYNFIFDGKTVTFMPLCYCKPYYHLVEKKK